MAMMWIVPIPLPPMQLMLQIERAERKEKKKQAENENQLKHSFRIVILLDICVRERKTGGVCVSVYVPKKTGKTHA